MEEDKIKEIFKAYEPELSSSLAFMERLDRNLNSIELIHRENAAVMRRNRLAVAIASIAGFLTGVIFTLMFPYIDSLVLALVNAILAAIQVPVQLYGLQIITWLLIGGVSVFVALNTYTLALNVRASRGGSRGGRRP